MAARNISEAEVEATIESPQIEYPGNDEPGRDPTTVLRRQIKGRAIKVIRRIADGKVVTVASPDE